jgi:hypothetical protein
MPTSLAARPMAYGDGVAVAGQDLRLAEAAQMTGCGAAGGTGLQARGGVRLTPVGTNLQVTAGSGLSVNVAIGQCWIPSASGDDGGPYELCLDTGGSLTVAAANPSLPRIDLVVAQVNDVGTSSSTYNVNIITGTAASSPSAPATPAGALALAQVNVAAGATGVTVTDERQWTVALGGILPVANAAAYPASSNSSDYVHNIATQRLVRGNGQAPRTAAFAPQIASGNTGIATSSSWSSGATVSVTCDGDTPVKADLSIGVFGFTGSVGNGFNLGLLRDGSPLDEWTLIVAQTSSGQLDGRAVWFADTPSAGTHTYAIAVSTQGAGTIQAESCTILVSAVSP